MEVLDGGLHTRKEFGLVELLDCRRPAELGQRLVEALQDDGGDAAAPTRQP